MSQRYWQRGPRILQQRSHWLASPYATEACPRQFRCLFRAPQVSLVTAHAGALVDCRPRFRLLCRVDCLLQRSLLGYDRRRRHHPPEITMHSTLPTLVNALEILMILASLWIPVQPGGVLRSTPAHHIAAVARANTAVSESSVM